MNINFTEGNEIVIREYQSKDCKEMLELFYNTVNTVNAKDYSQAQLNQWATKNIDMHSWDKSFLEHYTLIAIKDNIIVGFGDIDNIGYLDKLYVHKDYQNQGIATLLCNNLESKFLTQNIITYASITAKPFFIKRGYETVYKNRISRNGIILINYKMIKRS